MSAEKRIPKERRLVERRRQRRRQMNLPVSVERRSGSDRRGPPRRRGIRRTGDTYLGKRKKHSR
ncbi:MAG TPA: hypothetical protein P5079_01365 [Elusimicrobiota bacterium]|nr:hypothetical protein [Elusimicrobiota bacterium]